jgi:hypothetical protein
MERKKNRAIKRKETTHLLSTSFVNRKKIKAFFFSFSFSLLSENMR